MSEPRRIVIIGGVAAGPKAAARARRLDPHADITIIERDRILSYAGCGLPYYISGMVDDRNDLMATPIGVLRDPEFFAKVKGINVLNETEALGIDRKTKEVEIRDLNTREISHLLYDKLIIATGAEPVVPPIPGRDLINVVQLKRVEDADVFRAHMVDGKCPNVVIVGGGLIGMEMTEAVTECGHAVTVVEMQDQILPMLDREMADLAEKRMRELGVTIKTGTGVQEIIGDENGEVAYVVTSDGARMPAQLVLMSIGVRPSITLATDAGLTIGPSGGIMVNEYMQTSDSDIFAAGDCAEKSCFVRGTRCFLPLGSVANKEGRVAASNALGRAERFPGVAGATALKVFDTNVGRAGLTAAQAEELGIPAMTATVSGFDKPHYYPDAKPVVVKLVAERATRKLIGIQGVGLGEVVKRVDVAVTAMTAGMTVDDVANLDLAYAPPYSEAMDILIHTANTLRNQLDGLVTGMTSLELKQKLADGEDIFLLNVVSPEEFAETHIPGSVLICLGEVRERFEEIPRDKPVVMYCKTTLRAYEAARFLSGQGYDNVSVLDGGMVAWPYETEGEA